MLPNLEHVQHLEALCVCALVLRIELNLLDSSPCMIMYEEKNGLAIARNSLNKFAYLDQTPEPFVDQMLTSLPLQVASAAGTTAKIPKTARETAMFVGKKY